MSENRPLQHCPPLNLATPMQSGLAKARVAGDREILSRTGVVVIGRNEGERLRCCFATLEHIANRVVYVDSGSSDGSVNLGRACTAGVIELDLNTPFTAARARNAGFAELMALRPTLDYVFFVDGDCEIIEGWLEKAVRFFNAHNDAAVVWGLRCEKHPEKSIYNELCDMEWADYPLGETKFCGGDALLRVDAFRQVNGYRAELICGEEPEMCVRLRKVGWRIWHLDDPMTIHDAAIYNFGQWWKRMLRGGYGSAQAAALHGAPPEQHGVVESRRAWFWGCFIPFFTLALWLAAGPWGLSLLLAYPLQVARISIQGNRTWRQNGLRATALVIGKFPEVLGQMKFKLDRYRHVQSHLIEYK